MFTSNQVTAAKELCRMREGNRSLLESIVVTAIIDSGTQKDDVLFSQKCKCLHLFLIHWLNMPRYILELESVMTDKELIAALESIKSNVENHPKIGDNLSVKRIAITVLRLNKLLREFNELVSRKFALAAKIRERAEKLKQHLNK
jgi:hypothetical protein